MLKRRIILKLIYATPTATNFGPRYIFPIMFTLFFVDLWLELCKAWGSTDVVFLTHGAIKYRQTQQEKHDQKAYSKSSVKDGGHQSPLILFLL